MNVILKNELRLPPMRLRIAEVDLVPAPSLTTTYRLSGGVKLALLEGVLIGNQVELVNDKYFITVYNTEPIAKVFEKGKVIGETLQ